MILYEKGILFQCIPRAFSFQYVRILIRINIILSFPQYITAIDVRYCCQVWNGKICKAIVFNHLSTIFNPQVIVIRMNILFFH